MAKGSYNRKASSQNALEIQNNVPSIGIPKDAPIASANIDTLDQTLNAANTLGVLNNALTENSRLDDMLLKTNALQKINIEELGIDAALKMDELKGDIQLQNMRTEVMGNFTDSYAKEKERILTEENGENLAAKMEAFAENFKGTWVGNSGRTELSDYATGYVNNALSYMAIDLNTRSYADEIGNLNKVSQESYMQFNNSLGIQVAQGTMSIDDAIVQSFNELSDKNIKGHFTPAQALALSKIYF